MRIQEIIHSYIKEYGEDKSCYNLDELKKSLDASSKYLLVDYLEDFQEDLDKTQISKYEESRTYVHRLDGVSLTLIVDEPADLLTWNFKTKT